jgi:hypothetical protein
MGQVGLPTDKHTDAPSCRYLSHKVERLTQVESGLVQVKDGCVKPSAHKERPHALVHRPVRTKGLSPEDKHDIGNKNCDEILPVAVTQMDSGLKEIFNGEKLVHAKKVWYGQGIRHIGH